jgi:hypothetical protein
MIPPTRMRAISARGDSLRKKLMRSLSRTREALVSSGRRVFLNRRRNRRDNKLKTFREKSRRIRRVLEFGNKLRRRSVLAIAGRDHGRGACVLRIDLVQSLVQPR